MKNKLTTNLIAVAMLVLFASLSANADRVGNGNGDGAFALAELAANNPGLKPQEVLLKAFEESAGRPIDHNFLPAGISTLSGYKIILYGADDFVGSDQTITFDKVNVGPLLPNLNQIYTYSLSEKNRQNEIVTANGMSTINHYKTKKASVEFRQYSNNVILAVSKFQPFRIDNKDVLLCWSNPGISWATFTVSPSESAKAGGVCAISYYWK